MSWRPASLWIGSGIILLLIMGSGVLSARVSNSDWQTTEESKQAGDALRSWTPKLPGWAFLADETLAEYAAQELQCQGYSMKQFANESGQVVSLGILLGPRQPMAVHSPEICYTGNTYEMIGDRERITIGEHEFWTILLRPINDDSRRLRVYYAWSNGGPWQAPQISRLAFLSKPYLYKIQVACPFSVGDRTDAGREFLTANMDELSSVVQ